MDWDYYQMTLAAQQGWQCPVCGKVNAPWVAQCPCDGKLKTYTTTTGTGETLEYKVDYTKPPYTEISTTGGQTIYTYNPLNTATAPKSTTTTISFSQPDENCESCVGGCDLCYECQDNDHFVYKGW